MHFCGSPTWNVRWSIKTEDLTFKNMASVVFK
jgi:hypothetical protein